MNAVERKRYLQFSPEFIGMLAHMSAKHPLDSLKIGEEQTAEGPRLRVTAPDGTYQETDNYATSYECPFYRGAKWADQSLWWHIELRDGTVVKAKGWDSKWDYNWTFCRSAEIEELIDLSIEERANQ